MNWKSGEERYKEFRQGHPYINQFVFNTACQLKIIDVQKPVLADFRQKLRYILQVYITGLTQRPTAIYIYGQFRRANYPCMSLDCWRKQGIRRKPTKVQEEHTTSTQKGSSWPVGLNPNHCTTVLLLNVLWKNFII